jgi:hypothetical protein
MPLEPKQILEFLGVPDTIEDIDGVKEYVQSNYFTSAQLEDPKDPIHKKYVHSIVGKMAGTTMQSLTKTIKSFDAELSPEEVKDLGIEKVVELGVRKVAELKDKKIAELTSQLSQGSDEKVKEYQTKLEKATQRERELQDLLTTNENRFKDFEHKHITELKGTKLQTKKDELFKQAKISKASELEREGFFAHLEKNFKFDLSDNGDLEVFTATGERIKHDKVNAKHKSPFEVVEAEARSKNIWDENPHGGSVIKRTTQFQSDSQADKGATTTPAGATILAGGRVRFIAPRK